MVVQIVNPLSRSGFMLCFALFPVLENGFSDTNTSGMTVLIAWMIFIIIAACANSNMAVGFLSGLLKFI